MLLSTAEVFIRHEPPLEAGALLPPCSAASSAPRTASRAGGPSPAAESGPAASRVLQRIGSCSGVGPLCLPLTSESVERRAVLGYGAPGGVGGNVLCPQSSRSGPSSQPEHRPRLFRSFGGPPRYSCLTLCAGCSQHGGTPPSHPSRPLDRIQSKGCHVYSDFPCNKSTENGNYKGQN